MEMRIQLLDAEIRGMERARDLLAPVTNEGRARIAVQGPVMALLTDRAASPYPDGLSAASVISRTRLPAASVTKFLGRALRTGLLRQSPTGKYTLPEPESVKEEAAE